MSILIAGGGTGGHIFPALSLAQGLKRKNPGSRIVLVGLNRRLELELFKKNNCDYRLLNLVTPPMKLSFTGILFLLQFIRALFQSYRLIRELKPRVAVGFGGYTSVPVILAAKLKHIPIIIHEQNVLPGRANRFLAGLADRVALSFRESRIFFKQKEKIVVTGNPLHFNFLNKSKADACDHFKLDKDKFTVLVVGGSQGARFLNQILTELTGLLTPEQKNKLQFIHLTGVNDFGWVQQNYRNYKVKAAVFSFLDEIGLAYNASDLVISRAGATTVAEICNFGLPAIFIPYPYAGGHQHYNALALKNKGAAVVLEQKRLTAVTLKNNLIDLMVNKEQLESISANSHKLSFTNARENLAQEVLSLC